MKLRVKKSTTVFSAGFVALGLIVLSGALFFTSLVKPAQAQSEGGRLITVYDRGEQASFITTKDTLKDALSEQDIHLDARDAVEPSLDEKLVAPDYHVNIYRARPVTVVDGVTRQKIVTPYQSADRIVKDADISLYPEDKTVLTRSGDIVNDGAGLQLEIVRATPFTLNLYGVKTEVRTQAKTVGDMLKEKRIVLGKSGRASVALDTPIAAGMEVRVWREGKQTVTAEETVAFAVEQVKDADRPVGYKEVKTPGVEGKRSVTYEIEIKDGHEVSRTEIASITTLEPVKQVEVVGAKLPTPTNPTENQILGKQMMLDFGYGEDQWACLYNLWMRESGWRVNAGNPSSGAYGIPQSLPASKMAVYGSDYMTSARTQITWGLNYIKGRYATPCGAWDAFQRQNWY